MSILLRGMEMPVIELEWTIRHGADGKWYAIDTNAETTDGEWHEIVPVLEYGRLLKVLKTERECVSRDCNRDCGKCDLSLERDEVLSAYDTLIALFADTAEEGER